MLLRSVPFRPSRKLRAVCSLTPTSASNGGWPCAVSQSAFVHDRIAGATQGGCPSRRHHDNWLRDLPIVSKHLRPGALRGTYLGCLNAARTIKGHRVWLLELKRAVIVKDVRFSELESPGAGPSPSYLPVLAWDNGLFYAYSSSSADDDDPVPTPSAYSRQLAITPLSTDNGDSTFHLEWDGMMSKFRGPAKSSSTWMQFVLTFEGQSDEAMAEGDASADTDTKVSNKVSELGDDNPSYLESPLVWFLRRLLYS
ncbi:uncharacterized protein UMAG_01584 [Mycosarcoma maydis]|uniref:Uncharacterized protein n=1 Tax=Mycosarcoma maydis TaxID=5270 RepID=A0A0D1E2Q0_MYCMD|nr:uncharacterized protein UMAG_01584 [Ustilago maydis 521]KIS70414.1 hypothetical protein UMAG_01584 [Ustilago maydis 521]|eukprot:XP_011387598.1 hypothetical protein UMAG_01584 [Ustilago maydis 521]